MRMKPRMIFVTVAVSLLVLPLALMAQDWTGMGRLQGKVLDQQGKPVTGALVTLHPAGTKEGPAPLHTNGDGFWAILGLASGQWQVSITKDGFLTSQGSVHVPNSGPVPNVVIKLKPIPKEMKERAATAAAVKTIDQGNELMKKGDYAGARKLYEEGLTHLQDKQKPIVLRGIAQTYFRENNVDEAVATLKRALAIVPKDPATLQLMASLLVSANREDEAKQYLDQIPAGSAIDADTVFNVGIKLYNEKKYDQAQSEFSRVVSAQPDNPDAYYYRGLCYLAQGNSAKAKPDLEKYLQLAPTGSHAEEVKEFLKSL